MGLMSWIGKVITLRDGPFWSAYFGGETWAGKPVNEVNSMQVSAWWRCVRLYADVVGSMPLKMYERTSTDDRRAVSPNDNDVARMVCVSPNPDQTRQEYWGGMSAGLAITGNAYSEKRYIGTRVVNLEPLPFDAYATRNRNSNRDLEVYWNDRGKEEKLPIAKVLQVRGFSVGKSDEGLSPLSAARQGLSIAMATEEAVGKTFAQGLRTSGFFTGPRLTEPQRNDFRKAFIDPIMGNDAKNHYGILENGFDFKPVNIAPKDAEMLLSRRFNVEEICRFMGVPPILVGHSAEGQTMWGTGVEAIINQWLTSGLNAFLTSIESSLHKRVLSPADQTRFYFEFERDSLLRLDSAARAEFINKQVQSAQMTPNEGRKTANRPPLDGGDVLLVNSTLVPLTEAGRKQLAPPTSPQAQVAPDQNSNPSEQQNGSNP